MYNKNEALTLKKIIVENLVIREICASSICDQWYYNENTSIYRQDFELVWRV